MKINKYYYTTTTSSSDVKCNVYGSSFVLSQRVYMHLLQVLIKPHSGQILI